jgi:hypothetical protein
VTEKYGLHLFSLVVLSLGATAACGSEPNSGDVDGGLDAAIGPDAGRPDAAPPDAAIRLDPSYALTGDVQQMATRGGTGGAAFQLICPTGFVAVGLEGDAGSRVDTVAVRCRELLDDGSLGENLHTTAKAGEVGGSPYAIDCPDGQAMVAIRGREDSNDIRSIGIDCAEVVPWIVEGRGHVRDDPLFGGSGGTEFFDLCSRGFFIAALSGHHAGIIHGLSARCDRAKDLNDHRSFGPFEHGTETAELPPRGGPDGRTIILECKDDELPIGYRGRAKDRVDRLQLVCGRLAADGSLTESGTSIVAGGLGGDDFEEYCPEDEAIVGLAGSAGTQIDSIRLLCAPIPGFVTDGTGVHPWGRRYGGSGGNAFEDVCPEGMFLQDIMVYPNNVLEAVTGRCLEIRGRE